jgi:hypothetical protein
MANYTGPPMTLGNMRSLGVRSVRAECRCGHGRCVLVDRLPDSVEVPAIAARLRCEACGSRPQSVQPDWREYRPSGVGR